MFRKREPLGFKTRRISAAHFLHHSKYDSRFSLSEYFEYLIPKLYGGDVTVISTQLSASCDIPATQSPRRKSWAKNSNSSWPIGSRIRTIVEPKLVPKQKSTTEISGPGLAQERGKRCLSIDLPNRHSCTRRHSAGFFLRARRLRTGRL